MGMEFGVYVGRTTLNERNERLDLKKLGLK